MNMKKKYLWILIVLIFFSFNTISFAEDDIKILNDITNYSTIILGESQKNIKIQLVEMEDDKIIKEVFSDDDGKFKITLENKLKANSHIKINAVDKNENRIITFKNIVVKDSNIEKLKIVNLDNSKMENDHNKKNKKEEIIFFLNKDFYLKRNENVTIYPLKDFLVFQNGRVFIPVNNFCEALKINCTFSKKSNTLVLTKKDKIILIDILNKMINIENKNYKTEVFFSNNTHYIPLREIATMFSYNVVFEKSNKSIHIY